MSEMKEFSAEGVHALVQFINNKDLAVVADAAAALRWLSVHPKNKETILHVGGVPALVNAVRRYKKGAIVKNCARALWTLADQATTRAAVEAAGGVHAVNLLCGRWPTEHE